jgi:hypothetical protein
MYSTYIITLICYFLFNMNFFLNFELLLLCQIKTVPFN